MKQFDHYVHCVTRIFCLEKDGSSSFGTGFIIGIHDNGDTHIPILVTNKHVIENSTEINIVLSIMDENGETIPNKFEYIKLPPFTEWYNHPEEDVDLCAILFGDIANQLREEKRNIKWSTINPVIIPTLDQLKNLNSIEDVIMIGYPIGLWDSVNNRPILRKGITATHPALNFDGKEEFIIDIAAFPGSSGSPVFLYKEGFNVINSIGTNLVNKEGKFYFIGVLYAGPMFSIDGELIISTIPTSRNLNISSKIPTNLGLVISSIKIKDFENIIPIYR